MRNLWGIIRGNFNYWRAATVRSVKNWLLPELQMLEKRISQQESRLWENEHPIKIKIGLTKKIKPASKENKKIVKAAKKEIKKGKKK